MSESSENPDEGELVSAESADSSDVLNMSDIMNLPSSSELSEDELLVYKELLVKAISNLRIGTFNVKSLEGEEKKAQFAAFLNGHDKQWDVIAVQEHKIRESCLNGRPLGQKSTFFHAQCGEGAAGGASSGTGFAVNNTLLERLHQRTAPVFTEIQHRLCYLDLLVTDSVIVRVIAIYQYLPPQDKEFSKFFKGWYTKLTKDAIDLMTCRNGLLQTFPSAIVIPVLCGDFNAHVGKQTKVRDRCLGIYNKDLKVDDPGLWLVSDCNNAGLAILNTFRKLWTKQHRGRWWTYRLKWADTDDGSAQDTLSMVDFFVIPEVWMALTRGNRERSLYKLHIVLMKHYRQFRSDHRLVVINLRIPSGHEALDMVQSFAGEPVVQRGSPSDPQILHLFFNRIREARISVHAVCVECSTIDVAKKLVEDILQEWSDPASQRAVNKLAKTYFIQGKEVLLTTTSAVEMEKVEEFLGQISCEKGRKLCWYDKCPKAHGNISVKWGDKECLMSSESIKFAGQTYSVKKNSVCEMEKRKKNITDNESRLNARSYMEKLDEFLDGSQFWISNKTNVKTALAAQSHLNALIDDTQRPNVNVIIEWMRRKFQWLMQCFIDDNIADLAYILWIPEDECGYPYTRQRGAPSRWIDDFRNVLRGGGCAIYRHYEFAGDWNNEKVNSWADQCLKVIGTHIGSTRKAVNITSRNTAGGREAITHLYGQASNARQLLNPPPLC